MYAFTIFYKLLIFSIKRRFHYVADIFSICSSGTPSHLGNTLEKFMLLYVYVYIYACVCVCVCHTNTLRVKNRHCGIYKHIHMYIFMWLLLGQHIFLCVWPHVFMCEVVVVWLCGVNSTYYTVSFAFYFIAACNVPDVGRVSCATGVKSQFPVEYF